MQNDSLPILENTLVGLVRQIVGRPEELAIETHKFGDIHIFNIVVHRSDYGKVVGREGKFIQALRSIIWTIGAKHGIKARVELAETE